MMDRCLITRRHALLLGTVATVGTMLLPKNAPAAEAAAGDSRTIMPLNDAWRFINRDETGAQQPSFDDSGWAFVTLPHTYNGIDGELHGHYYRGPAWYRHDLNVIAASGNRHYLYFGGAATVADVYVNGQQVGTHSGNFAGFCIDITDALSSSEKNVLAVRVDNSWNKDIAPLAGDFNIFGGLYRSVHLLTLNDVSISPLDYGSPGVYILQDQVSQDSAHLRLTAILRNSTAQPVDLVLEWHLLDHTGNAVASSRHTVHVDAGISAEAQTAMRIHQPHLWHGRIDPYLYTMRVTVTNNDRIVDQLDQPVGIRYFHVDPQTGFYLNGKAYPLRGVCAHDDRPGVGRAVTESDYLQDCAVIQEVGANVVRLAHYQHDQTMYKAFDRSGILVWTEDGLVNHIEQGPKFAGNARQQVIELVKQNYNHPSVIVWSLYNELSFSTPLQSQLRMDFPQTPVLTSQYRFGQLPPSELALSWQLLFELNQLVHDLDPSRLTVAATDQNAFHPINYISDMIAFNSYQGWYGGTPASWPTALDLIRRDVHERMPGRCIGLSEYGAGANPFQHAYPVHQPQPGGQFHPEEWQCIVHEAAWRAIQQRSWLWITTLWVMFDFSSSGRNEGGNPGRNDKGLISYDRKIKKDAFYFYKAQWSSEPFVHICDRRFTPRPAGKWPVKVYTNCPRIELLVNKKSVGILEPNDGVAVWNNVAYAPGQMTVSAKGTDSSGKHYHDAYTVEVQPS